MFIHGGERVLYGRGGGFVVTRAVGQRPVDGVNRAIESGIHVGKARLGIAHQCLGTRAGLARLRQQVARRIQKACGGAQDPRELGRRLGRIAQRLDARRECAAQVRRVVGDLITVQVIEQARRGGQSHLADSLGERLVDLLAHRTRGLVGHAGRDGVGLLVLVVHDLGVLGIARKDRHHARAEILGNHDGCIVLAGAHALDRLALLDEDPVNVVVLT